jgi:Flp pilus assembly pilin Flp
MTGSSHMTLKRFAADERGATLTELVIILPVLLLLVLGAVEFGRLGFNQTTAQKATEIAVRTAAVRPAICDGVPDEFEPVTTSVNPPKYGTMCSVGGVCRPVGFDEMPPCNLANPGTGTSMPNGRWTVQDRADAADEIWAAIEPLLPNAITREHIWLRYTHDPRLGFLGKPYTPIVTVEIAENVALSGTGEPVIERLDHRFITPLGALAELATLGASSGIADSIEFPTMSASLPAEDLGQGTGVN